MAITDGDTIYASHHWGSGTSFPGSPVAGQWFYRTDESKLYRYIDSSWTQIFPIAKKTSVASSATPTPARASEKTLYEITALATNPTFGAPTGSPQAGDALLIWITDNGTGRTISWNAAYTDGTVARPTSTTASTRLVILFIYDGTNWRCEHSAEDV